ncbi:MAG: LysM peptidoglycan-binding domain-containing protein [Thermoanaerobaculales bacterium]
MRFSQGETIGRLLLIAAPAVLLFSCTSTPSPTSQATTRIESRTDADRRWEDATRQRTDELMAQAQELVVGGHFSEALDRVEEAICEILVTPQGYESGPPYIDYLASLLEEADDLEESLRHLEDELQTPEELVVLPPIEVIIEDQVDTVMTAEGPLPPSDFPLVLNRTVESYLDALTEPGEFHQRIETGLQRAGAYLPMIRARFGRAGLPEDLAYLPLIESAFSTTAYSRARAHGMWQFIAATGRHYGLEVGTLVDERRDPVLSTEAAIAYLHDLHTQFDDWYLALAGYNSGSGNIRRAIRRSGSRDFWELRRYLPRETRNYVPAFIASVIIAKQPQKYGFSAPTERPWQYDSVDVPDALDLQFLASNSGIPLDDLRKLNPAIRRDLTPARRVTSLRLPLGTAASAQAALDSTPREKWAPRMIHTVRSGESLYSISRKYGSNVSAIRQANGLRGSLIRPGQSLVVPRFGDGGTAAKPQPARTSDDGTYVVKGRDTLWDIAQSFGVSVSALRRSNDLPTSRIYPGTVLVIPGDAHPTTSSSQTVSATTTYRVRRGDTLYDIARRFGTSVSAIRRANGLSSSRIYPGDVIRIPSRQAQG